MPVFKMSMLFNLGRQGWSESFYLTKDTGKAAITAAETITVKRQGIMAGNVSVDGVRLSEVGVRGSTLPVPVNPGGGANAFLQPDSAEALLWSLRFSSGAGGDADSVYRRNYSLRGCSPGAAIGQPPIGGAAGGPASTQELGEVISPIWFAAFSAYFAALVAQGAQAKVTTKSTAVTVITSAVADANGNAQMNVSGANPYAVGQKVLISGMVRGWKKVNGRYTVIPNLIPNPNGVTIAVKAGAGVFFPPAFAQLVSPVFANMTSAAFLRTVFRDTGKVFFATVGRYKTRPQRI